MGCVIDYIKYGVQLLHYDGLPLPASAVYKWFVH